MFPWASRAGLLVLLCLSASADTPEDRFEMRVRPILARNCFACHTASKMGGLAMTSREALLRGGKGGPAIVEGKPEESRLMRAVRQDDESVRAMPPMGKLKPEEIDVLAEWIRDGAVWPRPAKSLAPATNVTPDQRAFWSFQPVRKVTPPVAGNSEWSKHPIDRFIYAKLHEHGLTPAPRAGRRVWIRRVTFDVTGLPPTPDEVRAYVNDHSAQAEAKVVDRLLASPRYGERWARHWLDVARYSDDRLESQKELVHPNAFRYRDWVIQAFNDDMPFDRFVMAQIAADQLPEPEREKLLPGLTFYGLSPEQQDERVDATTRGFMGLTVACAQCHDHKFDPIPQADFYSLQGIFNNTVVDEVPLASKEEVERWKAHKKRLDDKEAELKKFQDEQAMIVAGMLAARTADYIRTVLGERGARDLDAETLERWRSYLKPGTHEHPFFDHWKEADRFQDLVVGVLAEKREIDEKNLIRLGGSSQRKDLSGTELLSLDRPKFRFYNELFGSRKSVLYYSGDEVDRWLGDLHRAHLGKLRSDAAEIKTSLPPQYPFLHAVKDVEEPKNGHILIRGSRDNPGAIVPRHFLSILSAADPKAYTVGSGRLQLARDIASPGNPLTPRVMVNRIWQHHFGTGIVATPSNFGQLGERPTHPELLDYLAARFVESGWSIKSVHREILLSRTYASAWARSASNEEKDPGNRYLWRANRQRLDVESMRDALLAVAGCLDTAQIGGPALRLTDEKNLRRTVYGFRSRRKLDPLLAMFDHPNPNTTNEQRNVTSVPVQRLYFLNSPLVLREAGMLAARLKGPDEQRIKDAYELVYARPPSGEELQLGLEFLKQGDDAWPRYAQVLLAANEFLYVE